MDNGLQSLILGLPRPAKRAIVMVVDASLAVFSVWIAYYLRLGYFQPLFEVHEGRSLLPAIIVSVVVSTPIFIIFGLYRTIFRYSGPTALAVGKAIVVYGAIFASVFTFSGSGVYRERLACYSRCIVFILCYLALLRVSCSATCMLNGCGKVASRGL